MTEDWQTSQQKCTNHHQLSWKARSLSQSELREGGSYGSEEGWGGGDVMLSSRDDDVHPAVKLKVYTD